MAMYVCFGAYACIKSFTGLFSEIVMNQDEIYALLLQDVEGYKEEIHRYRKHLITVTVMKGSLLIHLNPLIINAIKKSHKCLVNYQVDNSGKNKELVLATSDVLFYLSKQQRDLLLGVTNPFNRLEVLGQLELVESLRKESEVYVTIAAITASPVRGIVRYIGGLPGEEGKKFGIELMVCMYLFVWRLMFFYGTYICKCNYHFHT